MHEPEWKGAEGFVDIFSFTRETHIPRVHLGYQWNVLVSLNKKQTIKENFIFCSQTIPNLYEDGGQTMLLEGRN